MIYLDNASTTNYKPQEIIDAVTECLTKYPFNPNRGNNKSAYALQQKLADVRKKLLLVYNCDGHAVFTGGCTQALNLAILGTARRGHVIISATEHNSVLRPVMQLKKRGYVEVTIVPPDENGQVTLESVQRAWRKDTFLLCVSHTSNVTGTRQNLSGLGSFVRQNNGYFLADCAQSVGYSTLDMESNCIDMVAIGAHKGLHAMQGAGALIFGKRITPNPITFGGTGSESQLYLQPTTIPDGLEAGTLPIPAILSMGAGVEWWVKNWKNSDAHIAEMQQTILDGLRQISDVKVYSEQNKSGIVAFNVGNADSNAVADMLQNSDITVRGGLQCSPLMHKHLGTFEQGVVRASVSCVTTKQECFSLLNAVDAICKKLK